MKSFQPLKHESITFSEKKLYHVSIATYFMGYLPYYGIKKKQCLLILLYAHVFALLIGSLESANIVTPLGTYLLIQYYKS